MPVDSPNTVHDAGQLSLVGIWRVLARRWPWVLASLVLFCSAGVAYLMLAKPIYQASTRIRVGQVAGSGPFEVPESMASRLLAAHGEIVAEGVRRPRPFLRRAVASKTVPNMVELVSEAYTPQAAGGFLENVAAEILTQHGEIYERNLRALDERAENLDSRRAALQQEYTQVSELTQQLKQADPAQASVVALERGRINEALAALDAEKPRLVQVMSRPATAPTELLGEITAPARAVSPRRAMVAALALLLGTLVGVVLAFLAEFASRMRAPRVSRP